SASPQSSPTSRSRPSRSAITSTRRTASSRSDSRPGCSNSGRAPRRRRVRRVEEPVLRVATIADEPAVDALMKASAAALFPRLYDGRQWESAVRYVAEVARSLLEDGTYFVLESGGELVGCGGWSRRDKLYTGSGAAAGDDRLLDPASEAARVRAMFVRSD